MTRTLLTVILAVLLLPTASLGQTPPGDHYVCYKAAQSKGETKLATTPKLLIDQLLNQTYDVTKIVSLCNPATKTHSGVTTAPQSPAVHQQGYQIKPPKGAPKFVASDHTVLDQFGSLQLTVKSPASLLVRASKTELGSDLPACKLTSACAPGLACIGGACIDPAFPPAPVDDGVVDNFKCYKVAIKKGTPKFDPIAGGLVEVTDQFGGPLKVEVVKPTKLCTPVNKENENPGAETHTGHLMCYQVTLTKTDPAQPKFVKTRVAVSNTNFPDTRLNATARAELCVPALKDPACVPGTTQPCYSGPAGTEGVGTCTGGTQTCNAIGTGYGTCVGEVTPAAEVCGDGLDNDCDGVAAACPASCVPIVENYCLTDSGALGECVANVCQPLPPSCCDSFEFAPVCFPSLDAYTCLANGGQRAVGMTACDLNGCATPETALPGACCAGQGGNPSLCGVAPTGTSEAERLCTEAGGIYTPNAVCVATGGVAVCDPR